MQKKLLALSTIQRISPEALRNLLDTVIDSATALELLGQPIDECDILVESKIGSRNLL